MFGNIIVAVVVVVLDVVIVDNVVALTAFESIEDRIAPVSGVVINFGVVVKLNWLKNFRFGCCCNSSRFFARY